MSRYAFFPRKHRKSPVAGFLGALDGRGIVPTKNPLYLALRMCKKKMQVITPYPFKGVITCIIAHAVQQYLFAFIAFIAHG